MKVIRKILRILILFLKIAGALLFAFVLFLIAKPLWNRYVVYPSLESERAELWKHYKKPDPYISTTDQKGVLHSHTYRSHDSRGVLPELLPAAHQAGLNFIFLADHRISDQDTFPRGIHGTFQGIVIESGTESPGASMMITPLRKTVLDWTQDRNKLINEVVKNGGMAFYLHSEDDHDWANPDYQGMEIYNIHTDLIDEKSPVSFLVNGMINSGRYRHWSYRELFDEQHKIVALWDSLNHHRRIVGMAAVDAHNNQSIRARFLPNGQVEWVGSNAKTMVIRKPNWLDKLLLGKPDAGGWSFKMELDTYFHSFNFANTHIFSDTLTSRALKNELVKGHAYISFESLAEAKGFQFFSKNKAGKVNSIMGDSIRSEEVATLAAVSPLPAKLELYKDGKLVDSKENSYTFDFPLANQKGNYRIVARLKLRNEWLPWVYSNMIYVY